MENCGCGDATHGCGIPAGALGAKPVTNPPAVIAGAFKSLIESAYSKGDYMQYRIEMKFKKPPTLIVNVEADGINQAKELAGVEAIAAGMGTPKKFIVLKCTPRW